MSADNGIYVAKFGDGEVRVAHCQAIDNCWHSDKENPLHIWLYFRLSPAHRGLQSAYLTAHRLEEQILTGDDGCGILEYGVLTIAFEHPFSWYEEEAKKDPEYNSDWDKLNVEEGS